MILILSLLLKKTGYVRNWDRLEVLDLLSYSTWIIRSVVVSCRSWVWETQPPSPSHAIGRQTYHSTLAKSYLTCRKMSMLCYSACNLSHRQHPAGGIAWCLPIPAKGLHRRWMPYWQQHCWVWDSASVSCIYECGKVWESSLQNGHWPQKQFQILPDSSSFGSCGGFFSFSLILLKRESLADWSTRPGSIKHGCQCLINTWS